MALRTCLLRFFSPPSFLAFLRAVLPYGLSVTSCRSIGQPFTDNTLQRAIGAFRIVYAKGFAFQIAEIELSQIAIARSMASLPEESAPA
jgi:hypothetical protein